MSTEQRLVSLRQGLQRFWAARTLRERYILRGAGWLLAVALLAQGLWSTWETRQRLLGQVPRLMNQAERMAGMRQAWMSLENQRPNRPQARPELVRQEVENSLLALGKQLEATWTPEGVVHVRGTVNFELWLRWLARLHEQHGLVVSSAQISASPLGQTVRVEARLEMAGTP